MIKGSSSGNRPFSWSDLTRPMTHHVIKLKDSRVARRHLSMDAVSLREIGTYLESGTLFLRISLISGLGFNSFPCVWELATFSNLWRGGSKGVHDFPSLILELKRSCTLVKADDMTSVQLRRELGGIALDDSPAEADKSKDLGLVDLEGDGNAVGNDLCIKSIIDRAGADEEGSS